MNYGLTAAAVLGVLALSAPKEPQHNLMKLPSFKGILEVRASIPGRMRLYVPSLSGSADQVKQAREQLLGTGVVHRVELEPRTGSMLVCYDERKVEAAVIETGLPIALHLDHGADFDICKACIDGGFSSVMIDGSKHSFEDNIALTRKVVEYAHAHGVVVEGELGKLAGIEDDVHVDAADSSYTQPNEVEEFVTRTGVDSLAIAIGTSHGAYKFTPEQCTRNADGVLVPPPLRFDILEEISRRLPGFPIVLHGASSVPQEFVREINALGGKMPDAIGIPEEQLRRAATMAVCKINIDSDIRLAMTAAIRRTFAEKPSVFDPREYLGAGREAVKAMVKHKIVDVLGSDNTL